MLKCPNPTCGKALERLERACPRCRTDLSLLIEYTDNLQEGIEKAEAAVRSGELGEAVWAYLSVLEVDPDNSEAKRQVGQVAAAVRQFDRIAVGRRWLDKIQRRARFRHWAETGGGSAGATGLAGLAALLLVFVALVVGYWMGFQTARVQPHPAPSSEQQLQ
jgi:hypothetical protein